MKYRIERDSIGEQKISAGKYYGAQTNRAIDNFKITGITLSDRPKFVKALAAIKQAAALTNLELGVLKEKTANAIIKASKEVYDGKLLDQFPVDMLQGGAGTSANMNANEVICNRALEILGHKKGEYKYVHPINHVNLSQSTNDVFPTAAKITIIWMTENMIVSIEELRDAFYSKAEEFKDVIKMGRTQLQDAVPMTLGQEFKAFGNTIDQDLRRLKTVLGLCREINMGATAIGTGINTLPSYAQTICNHLSKITGLELFEASDLVAATSDTGVFVSFSSILKRFAIKLTKTCNDLRLLSSGPKTGFHDITLPAAQAGSSIMPGKVNPVIPEVVNQVCFQIIAYDTAITLAASNGQLQLNAFEPIIIYNIFDGITLLRRACNTLVNKCVLGITANAEHCRKEVIESAGLLTAFAPYIGYDEAAKIAKQIQKSDKTVYELIKESGFLDNDDIATILSPQSMITPHARYNIVAKVQAKQKEK